MTDPYLNRRKVLGGFAAGAGAAWFADGLAPSTAAAATAGGPVAGRSGHYVPNRAPLAAVPFQKLPPGAVRPRGWLAQQLVLQVNGLCGRYDDVSEYLVYEENGWVDPAKWAWEELPYWLRGLGDLGYVTGDERILGNAERWITGIMATQARDGWFGPEGLRTSLEGGPDFWPGMPLLGALRSWHEYTGDEAVLPFLTRYFAFQDRQPAEVFNRSWGAFRWGDNIDSAYWLYNRTGETWLLDLVRTMHAGSADYTSGIPNWHNVNLAQGFREPLQFGLLSGEPLHREATYRNYRTIMDTYGRFAGGGFAGDENSRPGFGDPRQGFETCGIVEFMHSFEMLTRFTADIAWADRCEELAFNLLPAAFDPEQKACHYITPANVVQLDDGHKHGQFQNGFPMLAYKPGIRQYRCCPHNYGMGWPYYAQEMWLATSDGGLAASLYGASDVRARVGSGEGAEVEIRQDTEYPFGDQVKLTVTAPRPTRFPLYLRIPGWADDATVRVGGKPLPIRCEPGGWVKVDRAWSSGEHLSLHLPMRVSVRRWKDNHDSVSVDRGPLTYSLQIAERYERFGGTEAWPELAVYPESSWNYALVDPRADRFDVVTRSVPAGSNPFTSEGAPIQLRARAKQLAEWEADAEDVVGLLQASPAASQAAVETVDLIPMGAARLRITSFPTTLPRSGGHRWGLRPIASASHVWDGDSYEALSDDRVPASSADTSIPRFTWWDRRGSIEWVQLDLREPRAVSEASAYWFDDTGFGQCRVPASWRVLWLDGSTWRPVTGADAYPTDLDRFNTVRFDRVRAQVFRVEVQLRPDVSGGILELRFK
ncbi:transcriptional initiation protein Tat [Kribbella turkmenica]|uniref:Transcriptional initiation protein Tat n=1 Tax=Kribbella turkmenica TaxID=2530375 RepID=A0A4V2YH56_9ACTN|nr:beta-L-arabinofuranosidase domain-containing protein [Kribbella turkmenica]TDD29647.1 transcriptional initiation protein Tat [Kribbella turkmenica]